MAKGDRTGNRKTREQPMRLNIVFLGLCLTEIK